jgi:hypothetical protein
LGEAESGSSGRKLGRKYVSDQTTTIEESVVAPAMNSRPSAWLTLRTDSDDLARYLVVN